MTKFLLLLALAMASTGASAISHSNDTPPEQVTYCRGFVVGALASDHVSGVSRVDLWLAYGYLVRVAAVEKEYLKPEFKEGRAQFTDPMAANDVQSLLDETDNDCGRSRTSRQISGW